MGNAVYAYPALNIFYIHIIHKILKFWRWISMVKNSFEFSSMFRYNDLIRDHLFYSLWEIDRFNPGSYNVWSLDG